MKRIQFINILAIISAPYLVGCYSSCNQDHERDQRLIEYYRQSSGKPFQWKAKEVIYDYNQVRRAILVPRTQEGSKEQIRQNLIKLENEIKIAMQWSNKPPVLKLPYARQVPVIDGCANEESWSKALVFRGSYELNKTKKTDVKSVWKLMYDNKYLYFSATFEDKNIVAAKDHRLYMGDSLELFIMPEIRYHTYVELVFAPDGRRYTQWVSQSLRSRFELSEYAPESLLVSSKRNKDGYSIEGKIGFWELPAYLRGNRPKSGEVLRLMLIRIDKDSSSNETSFTPVPFLYSGHNFFGYMFLVLG